MDTRLRDLLHDLASEMPVELDSTGPRTLRKARGRRALTGAGAVVAVVAFVAVSVSAIRLVSDPSTPVPSTTGPSPATPILTGVPADVAATAQRIYDAAKAKDFDALSELIDPNTFIYNLGDASDPIPEWRANPSELDLMVAILEMPPTSREIEGMGTFSFWPYLVNSDFENLAPQERADLAALGYSEDDIALIADGGTGYQGPRLAIDENGEWRNFITVGE